VNKSVVQKLILFTFGWVGYEQS